MASASLSATLWHPVAPIAAMRHMNPADFIPFIGLSSELEFL